MDRHDGLRDTVPRGTCCHLASGGGEKYRRRLDLPWGFVSDMHSKRRQNSTLNWLCTLASPLVDTSNPPSSAPLPNGHLYRSDGLAEVVLPTCSTPTPSA